MPWDKCECGSRKRTCAAKCKWCARNWKPKPRCYYRLKNIWRNMIDRCYNVEHPSYYNYGKRGISVWRYWHIFDNFYEWSLANGYDEKLQIDRIDNNGIYHQNNCRWVTHKENCNNKRNNRFITFDNQTLTISQWADKYNINAKVLGNKLKRNNYQLTDSLLK